MFQKSCVVAQNGDRRFYILDQDLMEPAYISCIYVLLSFPLIITPKATKYKTRASFGFFLYVVLYEWKMWVWNAREHPLWYDIHQYDFIDLTLWFLPEDPTAMPELQYKILFPFSHYPFTLNLAMSFSFKNWPRLKDWLLEWEKHLVADLSLFLSLSLHRDLCVLSSANEPACVISNVILKLN